MIDHDKIIEEQKIDQEIILALESSEYGFDEEEEIEEYLVAISMLREEDDYGEERYFERQFSIKGTKIA